LSKAIWELGFGVLITDQFDQQAYKDVAVIFIVGVPLLERLFPNQIRYAANALAFVQVETFSG
jgi:hypothetical protein